MSRSDRTLRDDLQEWTDRDIAAYSLGLHLGLWGAEVPFQTDLKHVFWTSNPVGNALFQMLAAMIKAGILEQDDEEERVRWRVEFRGTWTSS